MTSTVWKKQQYGKFNPVYYHSFLKIYQKKLLKVLKTKDSFFFFCKSEPQMQSHRFLHKEDVTNLTLSDQYVQ